MGKKVIGIFNYGRPIALENCEKYFHMAVSAGENADELKELFEIYTIEFNKSESKNEDE